MSTIHILLLIFAVLLLIGAWFRGKKELKWIDRKLKTVDELMERQKKELQKASEPAKRAPSRHLSPVPSYEGKALGNQEQTPRRRDDDDGMAAALIAQDLLSSARQPDPVHHDPAPSHHHDNSSHDHSSSSSHDSGSSFDSGSSSYDGGSSDGGSSGGFD